MWCWGVAKITQVSPTETLRTEAEATPSTLKITCRWGGGASQPLPSFSVLIDSSDCGDGLHVSIRVHLRGPWRPGAGSPGRQSWDPPVPFDWSPSWSPPPASCCWSSSSPVRQHSAASQPVRAQHQTCDRQTGPQNLNQLLSTF